MYSQASSPNGVNINTGGAQSIYSDGYSAVPQSDEKGTLPINLNPLQTIRLRLMFLTSRYLRMANEEMKNMLFTHPFDVFLGTDKRNILKKTFKESIIGEYWMPALKKMHDWLLQFGLAPYIIRPITFPSMTPHFDINMGQKSSSSSPVFSSSGYSKETHNVIEIPDFDSGFISTYVDSNFKQQFLWTWHHQAVPQTFDNTDGYTDRNVKFIVKYPPTIRGEYTCPLRSSIKEWLYLNSRKKMDSLVMRDCLNPILVVEKQEAHGSKTPSVIDELSVNYSAAFNTGKLNYQSLENEERHGLNPNTGEMNVGYGKSVKFDTTRIDGLTDAGLTTYTDKYGDPLRTEGPDYSTLVSTMEFNRRATGVNERAGLRTTPFGFGGINDDALTTDLDGFMTTFGSDPIMTNPMSGIGFRVKPMRENEKLVEINNDGLKLYVNTVSIDLHEKSLEESLCFLAGFPAAFILGRAGNHSRGGGKSSKSSNGAASSSSSGNSPSSSDNEQSKSFLIGRLRHFKVYYQHQITKMFLKCYSETFTISKFNLLNQLDENYWFVLEQVYALKVDLPVDPPPMEMSTLSDNFGSGIVTAEEVIRNTRLNMGLSLDVMDDPEFIANAKKKMEKKYDVETQLQLQQKYTVKSDGTGKDNKRKASSESKRKDNGSKKPKTKK